MRLSPSARRNALYALCAVAFAVAGYKLVGPETLKPDINSASASGVSASPVEAQNELAARIVTGDDVGPTWSPAGTPAESPSPLCPVTTAAAIPAAARVAVAFSSPQGTAQLSETLRSYEGAGAEQVLAALRTQAPTCKEFQVGSSTYQLTQLTSPSLGDEAVAFEVVTDTGVTADMVYVRVDRVVATIAHVRSGGPDVATTESFVRAALNRMGVTTS